MSLAYQDGKPIHTGKIFWASFLTLIAAGVGFAIRGAILGDWGAKYGFTKYDLGSITGGGLAGFGFTIIACSLVADKVGYRALLSLAFILHVLSALITLCAGYVHFQFGRDYTYWCLYVGAFVFSLGNGACEAAINPLVATLYPKQKTHYLNILHAGWPAGLILGGLFNYFFVGQNAQFRLPYWEIPMALFLIPVLWYGYIVIKERFPVSEAVAAGVSLPTMILQIFHPLLVFLLLIHAMVGYVELGTDSWITNIMTNVVGNNATLVLTYTSALMFVLRFFAGPIVHRINPLGLLFVSAVLGAFGLYSLGCASTGMAIVVAATVYGLGKTFYWPTMLGVIGERFPKGGAFVMGLSGGIGMLSAGLLGAPGIGYTQDYYASAHLKERAPQVFARYEAAKEHSFLFFPATTGLDGEKVGVLLDKNGEEQLQKAVDNLETEKNTPLAKRQDEIRGLAAWWQGAKKLAGVNKPLVEEATIEGGQMALKWTAAVPATMAVCYLILVGIFASSGGYKQVHLEAGGEEVEEEANAPEH